MDFIKTNYYEFHTKNIEYPFKIFPNDDKYNFGVVTIDVNKLPPETRDISIFIDIDSSASMSDNCIDGRAKIDHLKHTLKNILLLFSKKTDMNIFVNIDTFSDNINTICNITKIDKDNVDEIIENIKNINPENGTNIELCLSNSFEKIKTYKSENPLHKIIYINMTDGVITIGSNKIKKLQRMVSDEYKNIFIGFGINHDAYLLNKLAESKENEYRFIDKLENTGLVYGEILHNILKCDMNGYTIEIENGLLYDWYTNTWVETLYLSGLYSEVKKYIHIKSETPDYVCLFLFKDYEVIDNICKLPDLYENMNKDINNSDHYTFVETDLTPFIFRQKTQELLYKVVQYNYVFMRKTNITR